MTRQLVLVPAALFWALLIQADRPEVHVGRNTPLAESNLQRLQVEPHLAVNPRNPSVLVAATMEFGPDTPTGSIGVYRSDDAGAIWTRAAFPAMGRSSDPWLAFAADGTLYLSHLTGPSLVLWRSDDGGTTWDGPATLPTEDGGPYDYPKLLVGDRPGAPKVVIVAAQSGVPLEGGGKADPVVLLSSADGRNFRRSVLRLGDVNIQPGVPAYLENGDLMIAVHELGTGRQRLVVPRLWTAVWGEASGFRSLRLAAQDFRSDSPSMAVDVTAGAFRDRIYIGSTGVGEGFHHYVLRSSDLGLTWSGPIRVSDASETKRVATHHPVMVVNNTGVLAMTWYDAREDPEGKCFNLYFSASLDGGTTFLPNAKVTTAASCPDTPANRTAIGSNSAVTVLRRFKEGGDYHGLVALPDNSFRAVWSDSRNGAYQLWTARVMVTVPPSR